MGNSGYQRAALVAVTVMLAAGSMCQLGCSAPTTSPSLSSIRAAAEQGDPTAQFKLGAAFEKGDGVKQDKREAVKWYRIAAEQGLAVAQSRLGFSYGNAIGVDEDQGEAVKWYRKAAEQGDLPAMFNLAICYENGIGVDDDQREADKWTRKAADLGYAEAQCSLGSSYEYGIGVDKDEREALKWFRKAADQGDAGGQCIVGRFYQEGKGGEKNQPEALKWFRMSAAQGCSAAERFLALCYEQGKGVDKDPREAVKWYRKAAEHGDLQSMWDLAERYQNGIDVDKDQREADKWTREANERIRKGPEKRHTVAKVKLKVLSPTTQSLNARLSPKKTLLDWDDHLNGTKIDDVLGTYGYSGDAQKGLAQVMAEEAVAYTKLQKAVNAKWGNDAETLVMHVCGVTTRADDEQAELLGWVGDQAVIKFKLNDVPPLRLICVDGVWKLDIASYAAASDDHLKATEDEIRQYTAIANSVTAALADAKYADADHLAKDIKQRMEKAP